MKRVILMGFMGTGKTTVGKCLAKELSVKFLDTDELIEKEQRKKISEIFAREGEEAFRDMETDMLKKLLECKEEFVLSIGGGTPLRKENRELLSKIGKVIYLKTTKEEILRRVSKSKNRPLLQGGAVEERITALMNTRAEIYEEAAGAEVWTDGKTPSEVAKKIIEMMK